MDSKSTQTGPSEWISVLYLHPHSQCSWRYPMAIEDEVHRLKRLREPAWPTYYKAQWPAEAPDTQRGGSLKGRTISVGI